ncbi:putative bifunctional diguanylate cyclase/phosphodiesterase [Methylobacterium sp. A54F]
MRSGGDAPEAEDLREARAELLGECLQLVNFAVLVHISVALTLAAIFFGKPERSYVLGLLAAVGLTTTAMLAAMRHLRGVLAGMPSEQDVLRGVALMSGLFLVLGAAWSTMPLTLFKPSVSDGYDVIAASIGTGLIATILVIGPLLPLGACFAAPLVSGIVVAVVRCDSPFDLWLSALLSIYALFILGLHVRACRRASRQALDRITIRHQGETIGLLLHDFAEGASDWLWETDADGRLLQVPTHMATALGRPAEDLRGVSLADLLAQHAGPETPSAAQPIFEAMLRRGAFQTVTVPLAIGGEVRWWQINGKPIHTSGRVFTGYRGVGSDITQARAAEARVAYLATHDVLTGLANRSAFQAAITLACDPVRRTDAMVCLLYLDLDRFKLVNDRAGHGGGDRLLQMVAQRLGARLPAGSQAFRLGGDEFAVLHPCAAADSASALATALVADLSRPYQVEGAHIEIGVSIGLAGTPLDAEEPMQLLARADLALFTAKANGKGDWRRFDPSLEEQAQRTRRLDADMRLALGRGEMDLHYQPLVRLADGEVDGFEALLRWNRPGYGWVSPAEIIPIAEETGFIVEIGSWALHKACRDALAWPGQRVAVNISSLQFRMPDFYDRVAEALDATGIEPERLEIEITESIILDLTGEVAENLRRLRERGVRIALDDFGTGYSSLSYLTHFHFNKIKIDRTFIRDIQNRPDTVAVVEAITALARALSMDVTVEGVETFEQCEILRLRRCGTAQGFFYSPARPPAEIPALVRDLRTRNAAVAERLTDAA